MNELHYYRRSGIAIIRLSEDPCDEDSLVLEISYFVDCKVERKASRLRADLLLLPCHSKHFHFLFLFISILRQVLVQLAYSRFKHDLVC